MEGLIVYAVTIGIMVPVFIAVLAPRVFLSLLTAAVWYVTPERFRVHLFMERSIDPGIATIRLRAPSWWRNRARKSELQAHDEQQSQPPSLPKPPADRS